MSHQSLGQFGEQLAVNFLEKHGYRIMARNFRLGHKEIDIISSFRNKIIFMEVKTRLINNLEPALFSFSERKIKNLQLAIQEYIYRYNLPEEYMQIDLIAIDIDQFRKKAKIQHLKHVF